MRQSVCLESWESSLWRTALLNSFQLNIVYGHFFFYWHGSVFTHDSSSSGVVNNPAYTLPFISIQSVSCHGDQRRQNTLYNVQPFFFLYVFLSVIYCIFCSADIIQGKNRSLTLNLLMHISLNFAVSSFFVLTFPHYSNSKEQDTSPLWL